MTLPERQTSLLEVRLGKPAHGGYCVARHDGRVVFVRGGLPGELVQVRITEDRGRFCRAEVVDVAEPSPHRVPAVCPAAAAGAGCCDLAHATVAAQREFKASVLVEQLQRLAGLDMPVELRALPGSADGTRWRTRVRLAVDADGRAGVHRYRSEEILGELSCPQPVPGTVDGIAGRRWRPGSQLQLAVDATGERQIVELSATRRHGGRGRGDVRRQRLLDGADRAREHVRDRVFEISAGGFWQAHRGAAQAYAEVVADWAALRTGEHAWDLYSGVGVFAAQLADQVGESGAVVAVESVAAAVHDGQRALADLPQVKFRSGRVERVLAELRHAPRVVVLDPPRAGAGRAVVEAITAREPARIIHIGCDPASFARDVGLYRAAGYRLESVTAFDAFPLTHHMEAIGLLVR
ncbi:class I SAM-dependent RNA methyltransferase [Skermania sp. ID1734]|uniref:class I SAM-dependent RNA methyltransferase n=1 Tax=Skermania sp. ID1734 TaxID=2597516 RepID=UPI00118174DA|nr:TRAM domain-containing protein [Skermania sp. ID1734]TSD96020.1 class I SAM-dependent RNA methyltransferase [Skermania sp. ID1734]